MIVVRMWCKESDEGDPAGYITTHDDAPDASAWDMQLEGTECIWIVPGTMG